MSKAIKAIAAPLTGGLTAVAGGLIGKGIGKIAGGSPKFKGAVRQIDEDAFKIIKADSAAERARDREKLTQARSEQAQTDRRQLIEQLQGQAAGTAPSLAEAQLKSAADRNLAQQLAAAQAQRGGSAALRERQLLRGQAQAGRELAQDAATARLQEQQAAQQLLAQQISEEQRLADQLTQQYLQTGFTIEQARQQAAADLEKLKTNQFLAAQGLTAASTEAAAGRKTQLLGGLLSAGGALGAAAISDKKEKKKIKKASKKDFMMSISTEEEKKNKKKDAFELDPEVTKKKDKVLKKADKALEAGKEANKQKSEKSDFRKKLAKMGKEKGKEMAATAFSGLQNSPDGSGAGRDLFERSKSEISDKKEKKNMKEMSDKDKKMNLKKDFLDKLQAYTYEYKNPEKPGAGEGRHLSVMAQDLEKTEVGKSMVKTMQDGTKMVDYGKGFGAILAAQSHLNKRLEELEKRSKKRK